MFKHQINCFGVVKLQFLAAYATFCNDAAIQFEIPSGSYVAFAAYLACAA